MSEIEAFEAIVQRADNGWEYLDDESIPREKREAQMTTFGDVLDSLSTLYNWLVDNGQKADADAIIQASRHFGRNAA